MEQTFSSFSSLGAKPRDPYTVLQNARASGRFTGLDLIRNLTTDFMELHGDRRFADDPAIVGGVGRLLGLPITVIAHEKGHDLSEKARRNFGSAHPEGYRKALRLMKQAEKFHRPVLTIVDTAGAFCGIGAEARGQGLAIAENLMEMMTLSTPVLALFIGEGGSGGALALAVADQVWMLENSVYSVISPEGCASILWKDAGKVRDACACLRMTPEDLLRLGAVERVIPESSDLEGFYAMLRQELSETFHRLLSLPSPELCQNRYGRFRKMGVFSE